MTAAAGAAKISQTLVDEPAAVALALSLVVAGGLVEGVALGVAQAAGLRRWLPRLDSRRWVLVTVTVAGLGWAAASAPAVLAGDSDGGSGGEPPLLLVLGGGAALGVAMGAVLGAAQALVLRGRVRHPWRWVGANALAWSPAMAVIFLGATAPAAGWPAPAVVALGTATGLAAGATLGLVSGWFLPSLTGPPQHNRLVLDVLRSPAHRLLDRSLVGLRVRGAVSGARFELPVMYAADGTGSLVVVVGRSQSKRWWRNLRRSAPVDLLHQGAWHPAVGETLMPEQDGYADAVAAYRRRWPRVPIAGTDPVVRVRPVDDSGSSSS